MAYIAGDTGNLCGELMRRLIVLSDLLGASIWINSGFRTSEQNRAVGGASNSYHMKGYAADISAEGYSPGEVASIADAKIGFGGIGLYIDFVHLDIRDIEGEYARWGDEIPPYQEKSTKQGRRKSMIEQGVPTKDGWWKAGWFTGNYAQLDHCALVITSGLNPPSRIDVYLEEPGGGKRGIKVLPAFKKHETKLLSNTDIPVNGMIWLKPEGGELLDVTVRTILK